MLKTFPMEYSDAAKDGGGKGPATIGSFLPVLTPRLLKHVGTNWFAVEQARPDCFTEEVMTPGCFIEGASRTIAVNAYERCAKARAACIQHHGTNCSVCGFSFQSMYGTIGAGFIHVHHLTPLSTLKKEYVVDPIRDMRPVCANCHAVIHRAEPALAIEELKRCIEVASRK
ncbi:HNH endonuclease [Planctomycetota bacterium]